MMIGDAINRLCILEIKQRRVVETVEIDEGVRKYALSHPLFYKLLTNINEYIWTLTNRIAFLESSDMLYIKSGEELLVYEAMRCRIKDWFDVIYSSKCVVPVKKCVLHIESDFIFYDKLPEFVFTILQYDAVFIASSINDVIRSIFPIPTLTYGDVDADNITNLRLSDIHYLDSTMRKSFELPTLQYIGSGLLGDFIHQLSVIQEMYRKTGRKGDLYISTAFESFQFGVERAFKDTYDLIIRQSYIASYQIDDGVKRDYIQLSRWRNSSRLYSASWFDIYKGTFGIEWGKHKWIEYISVDPKWEGSVLLNYNPKRSMVASELKALYALYGDSMTFVSFSVDDYIDCMNVLGVSIPFYKPASLFDMCVCINSCKLFIGGLTAPLAFSMALHKPSLVLKPPSRSQYSVDFVHFVDLENHLPYIMRIV